MLEAYGPFGNPSSPFRKGGDPNILEDPVIKDIAEKHTVTIAQVTKTLHAVLTMCAISSIIGLHCLCS